MLLLLALLAAIAALIALALHGVAAQRTKPHVTAHPTGQWIAEPELRAPPPRDIRARNILLVHRIWLYVSLLTLTFIFNPGPSLSRAEWEDGLMLMGLLASCIAMCVQHELQWRKERRLVAEGTPVKGLISGAEPLYFYSNRGKIQTALFGRGRLLGYSWRVEYDYHGRRSQNGEAFWKPAVGDIVTVLVDPQDPERIVLYPISNFRCAGL